ncbi:MAG: TSUP family transporter, partial [Alphaproteobacteria bacterium]|nr:TSUP family transporter [Alphaproteobacteria bacterium]
NVSRAFIHRGHLRFSSVKYYLAGMAVSFCVISLFRFVPGKALVFGMLGIGPFIPQIFRGRVKLDFTKPSHAFFCGLAITCMQLMAGVSGAALSMFFQDIDMTRHEVISTKAFTQAISHVTKLAYFGLVVPRAHAVAGLPPWIYVAVVPAAVLGANIGRHVLNRITDRQFYKATQVTLWALGAVYLCKAALLLAQRHA